MMYLIVKSALSGVVVALVSEIAKRNPTFGALVVSLPLISLLAILWLWRDTGDSLRIAAHAQATFWYVLPSLPMFLLLPALLRGGVNFWLALVAGIALTIVLYMLTAMIAAKFGMRL
ncbi:MAG: DUF3147 family protein [Alphaproteobacteria bacterium]|nr:DUF3147 family protein [Alphaproteobacteria bacterium]